jgi:hypothetical protein
MAYVDSYRVSTYSLIAISSKASALSGGSPFSPDQVFQFLLLLGWKRLAGIAGGMKLIHELAQPGLLFLPMAHEVSTIARTDVEVNLPLESRMGTRQDSGMTAR